MCYYIGMVNGSFVLSHHTHFGDGGNGDGQNEFCNLSSNARAVDNIWQAICHVAIFTLGGCDRMNAAAPKKPRVYGWVAAKFILGKVSPLSQNIFQ